MRERVTLALRMVMLCALAAPLAAQGARTQLPSGTRPAERSRADSLIESGWLEEGEDLLYAAVRARPREPSARGALAAYLATRGQLRVAEVLFDEARRFGADEVRVTQALAAMAPWSEGRVDPDTLPAVRLPEALRARRELRRQRGWIARWGGEGYLDLPFTFVTEGSIIGHFVIEGPRGPMIAEVDVSITGLLLHSARDTAIEVETFGGDGPGTPVLIRELRLGGERWTSVDARIDPRVPAGRVRVGLDVLWWRAPRFEPATGRIKLAPLDARPESVTEGAGAGGGPAAAEEWPYLLGFPGVRVVMRTGSAPVALEDPRVRSRLQGRRWRVDAIRGSIIVER